MDLGKLHVVILHFPLGLIIAAFAADVLWLITRREFFKSAGFYCIVLGAVSAIPTAVTGDMRLDSLFGEGPVPALAATHQALGITAAVLACLAGLVRLLQRWRLLSRWWPYAYGALLAGAVAFVSAAGHYGGLWIFGLDYLSGLFGK